LKKYRITLLFLFTIVWISIFLVGCENQLSATQTSEKVNGDVTISQGEVQGLQDEKPEKINNLLVNQIGYDTSARKLVIYRDSGSDKYFEVIDADTNEVVYASAIIEKEYNDKTDEYIAYGDFSKIADAGDYFVKTDSGISEIFHIDDFVYRDMLEAQKDFIFGKANAYGQKENVLVVADLVLSYKYFPNLYNKEENTEPDILREARLRVDALLREQDKSAAAIAVITMFAGIYETYDTDYAAECLTAAVEGWESINKEILPEDEHYWALAELYKATGGKKYVQELEIFFKQDTPKGMGKDGVGYYGTLAYLTTTYKTDADICTSLMDQFFADAINIIETSSKDGYKISAGEVYTEQSCYQVLQNARLLTLMNIISNSMDYILGVENHLDYLCGKNPYRVCYFSEENDIYGEESFIFILSGLMNASESEGVM